MNIIEIIKSRRSVRSFLEKAVEKDKLEYILECAKHAPSAVNYQPWKFYIIQSEEAKEKVRKCYPRGWFKNENIPVYILACIDHSESWKRDYDMKDHGDIDIAIAFEHICLSATEMGLGTCWVCHFDPKLCSEIFDLPEHLEPAILTPLGYPDESKGVKRTDRKDINETTKFL